ncbi:hypothetical protein LCGC14_1469330 [marine sediment metagenome]|uniref:Uncharacterized protein n=1 Tax=marine sediment metagenome TaxID=412755 RepID=A0A0F9MEM3_9ZZZZ
MITKNEIDVQIALGTVDTPQQIARLVRNTVDVEALEWAIKYRNTKVRAAAINNAALPIGLLLCACVFETSKTTKEVLERVVSERRGEIECVLNVIKYYPQLSMDWNDAATPKHS